MSATTHLSEKTKKLLDELKTKFDITDDEKFYKMAFDAWKEITEEENLPGKHKKKAPPKPQDDGKKN